MTTASQPDKATLLRLYRDMLVIRRTEEQLAKSHQAGLVHGACHTYIGEEAVAVGVLAHANHQDAVFSTHRGHGHALAKGVTPLEVIAELYGRVNGCSQGRGGSMHLFAPEVGMMGTSGIVGPCILQATGAGFSFKLRGTDNVGFAFFGDGASNNGAFHEGINMAAIWDLPTIFVCENNMYATEIPIAYSARVSDISQRAAGYGIPGVTVDGNDVLAIYEVAGAAIERARSGGGPTLIECKTYRTRAHSEGARDDGSYRSFDEINEWKARDPIPALREHIIKTGQATDEELTAIDSEVQAMVAEAHEIAKNSPYPDPATASDHIYSAA
jgi:2-oxoisovalerate dehydrogenase E1 component